MSTFLKTYRLSFIFFLALVTSVVHAAEPLKIGFVYVGPIGDHGWTYQHNQGRLAIEREFGDRVKTTYVESVKEGADSERVIRQLASTGHQLIFTTSFGFMNPTLKVAKQFPQVRFEHATGYKRGANVATYTARFYEGRYIAGVIAGRITDSNTIGYVASFPIPEVVRGINAFTLGLRKVNPQATVKVVWVNSWYDPGKEGAAARALIDQGADVLLQHTDSPAPMQAAEERGIYAVGQASDMRRFGPKAQLTAIVNRWSGYYVQRTRQVMDSTWSSEDTWGGLAAGMLTMASYNKNLPAEIVAEAKQLEADIRSAKVHPFQGPIKDQAGKERLARGQTLDDNMLLGMNWYVQGVEGSLPQ